MSSVLPERSRGESTARVIVAQLAAFLVTLTRSWTSLACPSCPVGRTARQQVCGEGFTTNLMIAIAPFVVIAMVCPWAERIGKVQ